MIGNRSVFAKAREWLVETSLAATALVSVAITCGIVLILLYESAPFFGTVSIGEFFGGTVWTPLFEPRSFGVLPLIAGTMVITAGAALIGLPLGIMTAVFMTEYCPGWLRSILKPVLEILAGIPTVVYGFFAVTVVTPFLRAVNPEIEVFNAASGAIVVAIMILPMVASLCDDAMMAVPKLIKEGGHALGATRFEVTMRVTIPAALSGIAASFILALSRAVGETMAVTLAAGSTPRMSLNPFESVQTLTAYIVQVSLGDVPHGTIEYQSIFAVGLTLFAITLVFNLISHKLVRKFRSAYS